MSEFFEHLDRLRGAEGKVALATLVNTRGTTPRKEGAKMLVGEGGRVLGSVTIGGCVDAQVIEESASVIEAHAPRLLELNLGDEEAWEIGLTCGGTIEVFVEPVDLRQPNDETLRLYEKLREHAEAGGRGALLTRLDAPHNGAKLLLLDTGAREGGLGDTALDERAAADALRLTRAGKSSTLTVDATRIFAEIFAPPSVMLIVGAGHVSMPLCSLARIVGFKTVVIDGRPRFATRERFPDADELKIGIPSACARDPGRLCRPSWLDPARQGDPASPARGRRGGEPTDPRASAHRARPRRAVRSRDRARGARGSPGRPAGRDLPADQREGQARGD